MPVKAKNIKDLPLKEVLDGSESLLVQDSNGTKQAPLGTIVDEIKQNSQEKIREIESELDQTNAQLSQKSSILNTLDFINVVSLGVDNSGQIDVADMLQDIIDNVRDHATIYFPTGEYLISKGLIVKKPITIKGNSRHINDIPPYGASIIKIKEGVSNITALSTENNGLRWSVDGITFYSTSFTLNHVEGVEVGLKYTPNIVNENVNGLRMGVDSHYSSCNNVFAWGFSGTGIHLGGDSLNKNICACHCGLGIVLETDASLDIFRSQFCDYGFEAKIGTTVTNGRVEEISKFGVTFNDAIGGLMRNVIIDQCGYSGIRLKGIVTEINVEVDIVRCCSYYYGLTTDQILSSENIKNEAIAKIYIDENASVSNNIIKDVGDLAMGLDDDVRGLFTPFFINTKSDIYGGCEFYCNGLNIGQKFSASSNNITLCEEYKKTIFRTTKDKLSNTIISDYKNSITIDNTMIRKIDNIIFGGTWIAPEFFGQFNISDNTLYIAKGLTASDWIPIKNLETIE